MATSLSDNTIANSLFASFFFFNDTATTEIYTLSLHDALPISTPIAARKTSRRPPTQTIRTPRRRPRRWIRGRSEEHTSELQSLAYLVCRLLLEKKKKNITPSQRTSPATRHHRLSQQRSTS